MITQFDNVMGAVLVSKKNKSQSENAQISEHDAGVSECLGERHGQREIKRIAKVMELLLLSHHLSVSNEAATANQSAPEKED